jgi:hypothetical protein
LRILAEQPVDEQPLQPHLVFGLQGVAVGLVGRRFRRGQRELGQLRLRGRATDQVEILVQSLRGLGGQCGLGFQPGEAVDGDAGALGHLPLLPGDVELDRGLRRGRGVHARRAADQLRDVPAQACGETHHGAGDRPSDRNVDASGKLGVREDSGLQQLRLGQRPPIPDRAQRRVGQHRDNRGLLRRQPVPGVQDDRLQDRVDQRPRLDAQRLGVRRRESPLDRRRIQRQGLVGARRGDEQRRQHDGDPPHRVVPCGRQLAHSP